MTTSAKPYKIPVSVLVIIHTPEGRILLLERADHPGWWQSVTGSQDAGESLIDTVIREVREETGIDVTRHHLVDRQHRNVYEIYDCYRHRYAPGITHNTEHVFSLEVADELVPKLAPREHIAWQWQPWQTAADLCFSPSNADAIRALCAPR